MMPMAADKTDQQMADLAVYFSQQKSGVSLADPALLAKGERLYRGGNAATGLLLVQVVTALRVKAMLMRPFLNWEVNTLTMSKRS
jgi:hypothetical protein